MRYTCKHCNKSWNLDDPGFVYWHVGSPTGAYPRQNLDGRDGRPRSGLGWFAHCADETACANRHRNLHAGLSAEQMTFCV